MQSARIGKLDPVIGRDDEIRRCVHILSRRTKNNPVLIGESGVGKTAIVEGLAQVCTWVKPCSVVVVGYSVAAIWVVNSGRCRAQM